MRLPPTPCRVCFRPCVFNKFSHFWQKLSKKSSLSRSNLNPHACVRGLVLRECPDLGDSIMSFP